MKQLVILLAIIFTFASCQKAITTEPEEVPSSLLEIKTYSIKGLNRDRKVRILLPKNYKKSKDNYPVLYMQDGQNLFEDSTSFVGEWKVDESLDELAAAHNFNMIVVGIDNGQGKRINEYSPWENSKYGKAEGEAYVDFIVNQLKPEIDRKYRTLKEKESTGIMGSSLGGFISHYAIFKYPQVFGKAGLLSTSYWYSEKVFEFTKLNPLPKYSKVFISVGAKETSLIEKCNEMYDLVLRLEHPKENTLLYLDEQGSHNESSWSRQFKIAVKWLFL